MLEGGRGRGRTSREPLHSSRFRSLASRFFVLAAVLAASCPARAQSIRDLYTKQEVMIPMRDGVKLFTSIYSPKDTSQAYPIMLQRTPYSVGPYGPDAYKGGLGPSPAFVKEGYIFAYQDVRGRYMSEGDFVDVRPHNPNKRAPQDIDESSDTYDTVEWLLKNVPNNNGKVGMYGISYPGFYVSVGIMDSHPAIKAASPQAPISDWFIGDDFHHKGAFFLYDAFAFYRGFGQPRPQPATSYPPGVPYTSQDAYTFFLQLGPLKNANERFFKGRLAFWNDLMSHPTYDSFWQARNTRQNLKSVKAAVLTVGGWFDAEDLFGAVNTYKAIESNNPGISNSLVMGPWWHGGWASGGADRMGDISFGSPTSATFQQTVELPFFNYYLKGKGTLQIPEAFVFNTGANEWRSFTSWPPAGTQSRSLFLREGRGLSFDAGRREGFDSYTSDPDAPVPYSNVIGTNRGIDYMIEDQRFASRRPDVLKYQTEPLSEDATVAGPLTADLFVSTTGTDADFVVKLIDVFPEDMEPERSPRGSILGGFQMLVRAEVMRARFRNSFAHPEPLKPGKVAEVKWELPDVCHTFKKGHRIMVQVQSSWFPLVDRNPQKFVDIYRASEADFQEAEHRVYFGVRHPSQLRVNLLPR